MKWNQAILVWKRKNTNIACRTEELHNCQKKNSSPNEATSPLLNWIVIFVDAFELTLRTKKTRVPDFYQNFRIVLKSMNGLNASNLFRSINLKENEKRK